MILTFLGTAAAEGVPAVFCNCKFCNEARRLGGKNIRTRSQSIVNDDLLIDIPADTFKALTEMYAGIAAKGVRQSWARTTPKLSSLWK